MKVASSSMEDEETRRPRLAEPGRASDPARAACRRASKGQRRRRKVIRNQTSVQAGPGRRAGRFQVFGWRGDRAGPVGRAAPFIADGGEKNEAKHHVGRGAGAEGGVSETAWVR